ncbi:ABC transporter permease [Lactococcus protaetiae]|uniref:ABC transporter permease n=1 Tax=Lactococcus protaetiae TaxID=2592653 RepID=A0A514Z992_9LACT|nr:ABC transporter permease [Lactococcus protaetiae]MCL2113499.1 ABC transporter permease [Streptococcaceae bacterium]QDK71144.1 ABC transporter permease [Lactococcus protaetiae]
MNLVNTLQIIVANMLIYSTPLIFTSIGGVFSERGGIVNVGLEGIMTMGAFSSVVFNLTTASIFGSMTPWISILFGALVGAVFASLHAVATVNFRADHIVSGTVLNLMAPALGVFLLQVLYNQGQININEQIGYWDFPLLSKIPVIGQIFFSQTSLPGFLAIVVAFIAWYVLFKTRFGLRLRSVGENPQAADTLGINVYAYRWAGVLLSGVLGGIGGAIYAQAISGNFAVSTIVGQGFISLAAMIFGKWNPIGAMLASLLFGLSTSLAVVGGQIPGIKEIPSAFLQMAPYVFTIIVLALFLGKAVAPKADGVNYIKSK